MMNRRGLWFLLSLGLLLSGVVYVQAQQSDRQYFPDTGHWVSGVFWAWWQAHPNSARVLQSPITEALRDEQSGGQVQYFVGGRLELPPGADSPAQVRLTPLGLYFHEENPGIPLNFPAPDAACRFFAETGVPVCYAFLDAFQSLGGLETLGFPISSIEYQEGMLVQYFQYGRLEWHPERPAGEQVLVTDLGLRYFRVLGLDTALLRPSSANILHPITHLEVRPSVRYAVTGSDMAQTLYVVVQDQIHTPIAGAQVTMQVIDAHGHTITYRLLPTDAHGLTRYTFSLAGMPLGWTQIEVTATFEGLQAAGRTVFLIWW